MKIWQKIVATVALLGAFVLAGYTVLSGFGNGHKGSARNITLGLDLNGGVSVTYQAVVLVLSFFVFRNRDNTEVCVAGSHVGNVVKAHPEEESVTCFKKLTVEDIALILPCMVVEVPNAVYDVDTL